jgi:DNA-binding PadR family transcriptional regulator
VGAEKTPEPVAATRRSAHSSDGSPPGALHFREVSSALLRQRPVNGYELLGQLGKLFSPGYVPSPGSVYPALSALSRSGLIEGKDDNGKKQYRLTPPGEEALDARRDQLSAIEARCGVYLRDRSDVEAELGRLEAAVSVASSRADPATLVSILRGATSQVKALGDPKEKP